MKWLTVRMIRRAAMMFVVLGITTVLSSLLIDEALTRHETRQLARAFDRVAPILVEHAPPELRMPVSEVPPPDVVEGRAGVHVGDDHYSVTIDAGNGTVVSVGELEWAWLPGSSGQILISVWLFLALLSAGLLTLPLLLRVRRLARHVETFARGHYDERAELAGGDEVAELAGHFNRMADAVQSNFEAQRALVQAIAHEYRTPLASARIAAALVMEANDAEDRAKQAKRLHGALEDLERLADEVRFYARAGEPAAAEAIDLAEIVRGRVERAQAHHDLAWTVEAPDALPWQGDLPLVARVVDNLLSNATRHADSAVQVSLAFDARFVTLSVEDDGPGVPVAQRETVLEPFVRLDKARGRSTGGHGLGLAIVSRMVRAAGGTVSIGDSALGGASAQIRLPVSGF